MTHLSLFTGIGGLDLAAEWAGFETVLQVEREPYALKVLYQHWPDVPKIADVREVTSESIDRAITVISGGFPCQPFSAAGKRRGVEDDRYLWPELLRIVEEIRPTWVVGENVSGLLSIDGGLEIDRMLASLEARDYTPWILHYPAAGIGAPHKRDRVFIVAHAKRRGRGEARKSRELEAVCRGWENDPSAITESNNVADTENKRDVRRYGGMGAIKEKYNYRRSSKDGGGQWWSIEPDVGRVANGVPHRVDRLRALGNAVVPQQAYPIFLGIANTGRRGIEAQPLRPQG